MIDELDKSRRDVSRENAVAPDRGRPSGHTPPDAHHHRAKDLPQEPPGPKNHLPIEKARPTDTDRGGA